MKTKITEKNRIAAEKIAETRCQRDEWTEILSRYSACDDMPYSGIIENMIENMIENRIERTLEEVIEKTIFATIDSLLEEALAWEYEKFYRIKMEENEKEEEEEY